MTVRLLTICLVLSLCLATAIPASAAENDMDRIIQKLMTVFDLSQSDYDNYDSNYAASLPVVYDQKSSSHYVAMGGISAGGLSVVGTNNCYAAQVAGKLNVQYTNIADYECNAAAAVNYVKSYADTVKKADLITFQLDAAPFILACVDSALANTPVNWSTYITDQSLIASMRDLRTQLVNEYGATYGRESAESIASLVEHLLYECVSYCFETVNAVNEIRKHNSNAVVLVLGLYNPLRNLVFTSGTQSLDISSIMDEMIKFCNVFLLKRTGSMKNTAFVAACDASTTGFGAVNIETQDQNTLQREMLKIVNASNKQYANKDGHNYMRDQVLNSLTPPCKHPNTTVKNTRSASCKEEGYTGDTVCSTCNTTVQTGTSIPKTDHKYGAWTQSKTPGCTTEGEQTRTCPVCGKKETQPVSATGHKYDAGTVTTKPGCTTEGVKTLKCTECNQTKTESIPATGHTFNQGTVIKAPGCETKGEKAVTCTVCGKATTESIPATGHAWDKGTVITAPGCETEGKKSFTCSVCNKNKTETIPATGHTWNEGTVITAPGCETEGEKAVTCTVCGKNTTETIPATGHTWDEGTVITKPGCETEGEKAVTCTVCGKATTQPIPATGHSYGDYLSNNDATCEKDGTKTAACTACGATDTQDDPGTRTAHSYKKGVCTLCGAEKPSSGTIWWILISVLVVAGAAAGVLFFLKRKKLQAPAE